MYCSAKALRIEGLLESRMCICAYALESSNMGAEINNKSPGTIQLYKVLRRSNYPERIDRRGKPLVVSVKRSYRC